MQVRQELFAKPVVQGGRVAVHTALQVGLALEGPLGSLCDDALCDSRVHFLESVVHNERVEQREAGEAIDIDRFGVQLVPLDPRRAARVL